MNDEEADRPDSRGSVPGSPPALLHGRAALYWGRLQLVAGIVNLLAVVAMPAIALLPDRPARVMLIPVAVFVGLGPGACGALFATIRKAGAVRRELAAGYTTLYRQATDYWQLDPKTGEVLRRPGELKARRRSPVDP